MGDSKVFIQLLGFIPTITIFFDRSEAVLTHRDDEITLQIDKVLNKEDTFDLDVRGVEVR